MRHNNVSVLVIGAQGVLGAHCARALRDMGYTVFRGGRRPENAEDFHFVDLEQPETIARSCRNVDLVLTTVADPGLGAERVLHQQGGLLINISSLPANTTQQALKLSGDSQGLVVLDAGVFPGITTLAFNELLTEYPDCNELEIGYTLSAFTSGGPRGFSFLTGQVLSQSRRDCCTIPFAPPLGPRQCIEFGRGEEGWFSNLREEYNCRSYIFFRPAVLHEIMCAFNHLGILKVMPTKLFAIGRRRIPRHLSREHGIYWMAVLQNGRRLAAYTLESVGDYQTTVVCTILIIEKLLQAVQTRPDLAGIHLLHHLFTFGEFRDQCAERGVHFRRHEV
jgi:hypothetical protein